MPEPERRALALPSPSSARRLVPFAPWTVQVTARRLLASLQVTVTWAAAAFSTAPAGTAGARGLDVGRRGRRRRRGGRGRLRRGLRLRLRAGFSSAAAAAASVRSSGPLTAVDGPW